MILVQCIDGFALNWISDFAVEEGFVTFQSNFWVHTAYERISLDILELANRETDLDWEMIWAVVKVNVGQSWS